MRHLYLTLLACLLTCALPAQLTVADGATLVVSPRVVFTDQLVSTGKMVVAPGGTLDLRGLLIGYGDLELRGTLVVGIVGPDRDTQYGDMFVDGTTSVGGALKIDLAPAYAPTGTVNYTLINALPVTGTFSTVDLPDADWSVVYEREKVILRLDKLPPAFELAAFTGEASGRAVDLSWMTSVERGSDYFAVERLDGGSWQEIDRVAAAGDDADGAGYTYRDRGVGSRASASYRLRLVAVDGRITYSDVIEILKPVYGADDVLVVAPGGTLYLRRGAFVVAAGKDIRFTVGSEVTNLGLIRTDLDVVAQGDYRTDLNGNIPVFNFGYLIAGGEARPAGELTVTAVPDYTPVDEVVHTLVFADRVTGSFASPPNLPAGDWRIVYTPTEANLVSGAEVATPVTWLSFTGRAVMGTVELDWVTADEHDSNYFRVERQAAEGDWEETGRVTAVGFSAEETAYTFVDTDPGPTDPVLYRLRQVDFDGTYAYSAIVAVSLPVATTLSLYPNPTSRLLYVSGELPSRDYRIVDVRGRVVLSGRLPAGERALIVLPEVLGAGVYFLQFGGAARRFSVVR